ncbi:hypothetical protein N7471_006147 [Penicillium samsonianum]|uniref:uncharacterized protein n=1 Tax=Penicillium samsonianum TaxID=1882272 RepID=UPI00254869E3|nr:uncharacterized protein N7471_006147 [Penicillium samsonianum]KAJ6139661.1 hypothetical protein N7471_006147 [Penicillium samsonianum]
MRGMLLASTPGCAVRGLDTRGAEGRNMYYYYHLSGIPTDYSETTPSKMIRERWHVLPYGGTEVQDRVCMPCV